MHHPVRVGLPLCVLLCAVATMAPVAPADPSCIYGMHDPGGEYLMGSHKGWIVWTEAIGTSGSGGNNYTSWSNQGYGVIVRLNNGYGSSGTLPYESQYGAFASRCANFIQNSSGVDYWIIGNETNLPREWPGNVNGDSGTGEPITSARYISCYNQCYSAIKAVAPSAKLCPSPAGTWAPPYPAQGIEEFVDYWVNCLNGIGASKIDGLILHTYTHGCDPALVTSEVKMGPPYEDIYYHLRVYKNYMWVIPAGMQNKPVLITECDQNVECADGATPRHTWYNVNNGWMKAVYAEIDNWNRNNSHQIRCLAMFRWPMTAEGEWTFGLADRDQCQADFAEAAAFGYQWGVGMTGDVPTGANLSLAYAQVSVSAQYDANSGGDQALDGVIDIESKWASDGTAMPEWLVVDLGSTRTINGYIVRHAEAANEPYYMNTEAFAIQSGTSMSGPWTDETVVDNTPQDPVTNRSYTTPKSLRYIRLYVTDAGIDNYVRIPEFEIIGLNNPPVIDQSSLYLTAEPDITCPSAINEITLSATDPDGDELTWSIPLNGVWGTASFVSSPIGHSATICYEPQIEGVFDSFDVDVRDAVGALDIVTVNVDIPFVDDFTPYLIGAVSRKTHGAAGDWDIDVGAGDIECRSAQVGTANPNELRIVATFDWPLYLQGSPDDVTTDVGTVSNVTQISSSAIDITIADLPLFGQLNLAFPGVSEGSPSTLCVRMIVGDYDNLGRTNFTDFAKIKNAGYVNQLVDSLDRARADFDCGGRPNFTDFARIKNAGLINKTAPACPDPPIGP